MKSQRKRYRYREGGELAPAQIEVLAAFVALHEHARQVRNLCKPIVSRYGPRHSLQNLNVPPTPEQLLVRYLVATLDDARAAYEAMKRDDYTAEIEFDYEKADILRHAPGLSGPRLKLRPPPAKVIDLTAYRLRRAAEGGR